MAHSSVDTSTAEPPVWPAMSSISSALLVYAAALAVTLAPWLPHLADHLPCSARNLSDPLQHLWIMRWYGSCLIEGRSPAFCADIQYPAGAPIGNFSPLHLQSLLFIPLRTVIPNDVLCFNIVLLFGLLTTGLGAYTLIWTLLRDSVASLLGGLLVMISTSVMIHVQATHLELVFLGAVPLFLAVWIRFLDAPNTRHMFAAVGCYWLTALSAAYYAVLITVPGTLIAASALAEAIRSSDLDRFRTQVRGLLGFGVLAALGLLPLFGGSIWSQAHEYALPRPPSDLTGTPPWTYFVPTTHHRLGSILPFDVHAAAGLGPMNGEQPSYLGIVTIALAYLGLIHRSRLPRSRTWWCALAVLVVLSWGAYAIIGTRPVPLPTRWIKAHVPIFEPIRVFARFNQLAAVVAAVLAAAGFRELLSRLSRRGARVAATLAVIALAIWDLAPTAFEFTPPPTPPAAYQLIADRDPSARILEIPQFQTGGGKLNAACAYWQSIHGRTTTAGYSGQANVRYDDLMIWDSPFWAARLADPRFPADPEHVDLGIVHDVRYLDAAWLYLAAHDMRYVVLHQWEGSVDDFPIISTSRIREILQPFVIHEDDASVTYDRARFPDPRRPVLQCLDGWRSLELHSRPNYRVMAQEGRIAVFNPSPSRGVRLTIEAQAFRRARTVHLRSGPRILARWSVAPGPGAYQTLVAEHVDLPMGLHELSLECDGEDRPVSREQVPGGIDMRPFSLRVAGLRIEQADERIDVPRMAGGRDARGDGIEVR